MQGVFFRDFTRRQANSLNIKGWVKNLPDGRVEAVGEGDEESLKEWLKRLHKGPPGALVNEIEINYEEPTDEFTTFEIIYY